MNSSNPIKPELQKLVELATYLEPMARAHGYHVGITGSCLYGKEKPFALMEHPAPEDMDLLFYWDSSKEPALTPPELLKNVFRIKAKNCADYPCPTRNVFSAQINGVKIDFIFLNA